MERRTFLKSILAGVGLAAAPSILLAESEPVRRYWQVPGNAPVRYRTVWLKGPETNRAPMNDPGVQIDLVAHLEELRAAAERDRFRKMSIEPIWLTENGFVWGAGGTAFALAK